MRHASFFEIAPMQGVTVATKYDAPGEVSERLYSVPQSSLGMYASLDGMLSYARFHLKQPPPTQHRILSDDWLDRMHNDRPDPATMESLIALGWGSIDLEGMLWLLTNGRAAGAQSTLSMIPSEALAVVCLTNISGNVTDETAFRITEVLVPGFLGRVERKQMAWEAQTAPPYEPTPELLGAWEGTIRTEEREIPVAIEFQEDGDVHVTLEGQYTALLNGVRYEDALLTGEFVGECPIEQPVTHPHTIQLGLRLQDRRLSGYAKSIFSNDAGYFALPAYASLTHHDARSTNE
jgi:hypothetical protein